MTNNTKQSRTVAIIGSGPAACTAAIYTARANLETIMFASAVNAGGELMNTTEVENYPGFPEGIQGPELMRRMLQQAENHNVKILHEDVLEVSLRDTTKTITTIDTEYTADAVILATGSAYRKIGVAGEEEYTGLGVSWCAVCDAPFFAGVNVVVVGGGDSAMEEALQLAQHAATVTIVHRSDNYRASEIMIDRAQQADNITFQSFTEVAEILGENGQVVAVRLRDTRTGAETVFQTEGVFIAIGSDPRTHLFKDKVERDSDSTVRTFRNTSATSVSGVFAAGDVQDARYRQAITAAGSGAMAALDAEKYIRENL